MTSRTEDIAQLIEFLPCRHEASIPSNTHTHTQRETERETVVHITVTDTPSKGMYLEIHNLKIIYQISTNDT